MPRAVMGLALLITGLGAALPAQRPVVTIASNGIVRVSQRVSLAVPAGRSEHRMVLPGAVALSLSSSTAGVQIMEVRRELVFDGIEALRKAVGRDFEFAQADGTTLTRRLVGVSPERWSHPSGAIDVAPAGRMLWPADLLAPVEGLLVTIASDRARQGLTLEYEVPGSAWVASYELRLGNASTFRGTAVLGTGALRLDTATVRLLAGDLGYGARTLPSLSVGYPNLSAGSTAGLLPVDRLGAVLAMQPGRSDEANTYVDGVPVAAASTLSGQVYRYELPSPVVFLPGREFAVPLLAEQRVEPTRSLSTGGALPPSGEIELARGTQSLRVLVSYAVSRRRGTPFGDAALPAGIVSVLKVDDDGTSTLIGRSRIQHGAPGSPLEVDLGGSFDVTATRVQTAYQIDRRNDRGEATAATVAYKINYRNSSDSAVIVTTYESRFGEWSVLESSHPAERQSSGNVAFAVTVPARGEATLTYRIRAAW
jgi:hypothetical protein